MKDIKVISFADAIKKSTDKPNLLLGNGFSIACKQDIFTYKALLDEANFKTKCPNGEKLFQIFQTSDFEAIIQKLEDSEMIKQIKKDAKCIRENLIKTLTAKHPNMPNEISNEQYKSCRIFLSCFDRIYTLNYDLLLYWTLMHDELDDLKIDCKDGFKKSEDASGYVVWDSGQYDQNIFYLHGALHLFDAGYEVQKYTWINTGVKLIDQIKVALDKKMFPLFVAEGTYKDKMRRIQHSNYLGRGFRSFESTGKELFVFGHSLSTNDEHIIKAIEKSKIERVFISIHGKLSSSNNIYLLNRANKIQNARLGKKHSFEVIYFDADSAKVWNS